MNGKILVCSFFGICILSNFVLSAQEHTLDKSSENIISQLIPLIKEYKINEACDIYQTYEKELIDRGQLKQILKAFKNLNIANKNADALLEDRKNFLQAKIQEYIHTYNPSESEQTLLNNAHTRLANLIVCHEAMSRIQKFVPESKNNELDTFERFICTIYPEYKRLTDKAFEPPIDHKKVSECISNLEGSIQTKTNLSFLDQLYAWVLDDCFDKALQLITQKISKKSYGEKIRCKSNKKQILLALLDKKITEHVQKESTALIQKQYQELLSNKTRAKAHTINTIFSGSPELRRQLSPSLEEFSVMVNAIQKTQTICVGNIDVPEEVLHNSAARYAQKTCLEIEVKKVNSVPIQQLQQLKDLVIKHCVNSKKKQ